MNKIRSLSCYLGVMLLGHSAQARLHAPLPTPQTVCLQVKSAFAKPLPPIDTDSLSLAMHKSTPSAEWAVLFSLISHPVARMVNIEAETEQSSSPVWFAPASCGAGQFMCRSNSGVSSSQIYRIVQGPLKGSVVAIEVTEKLGKQNETLTFYTPAYVRYGKEKGLLDENLSCAAQKLTVQRSGTRAEEHFAAARGSHYFCHHYLVRDLYPRGSTPILSDINSLSQVRLPDGNSCLSHIHPCDSLTIGGYPFRSRNK